MIVKMFEIRDRATFIPVMCVKMVGANVDQDYLVLRAGYHSGNPCYLLIDPRGRGIANYDPYDWGNRTFLVAHDYINKNWDSMKDGDVIDVEFISGETTIKKKSERYDQFINGSYITAYED